MATSSAPPPRDRRVACCILPELACELGRLNRPPPSCQTSPPRSASQPLGIVFFDDVDSDTSLAELARRLESTSRLAAVDSLARRLGVRPEQTLAEALSACSHLEVRALPRRLLAETLHHIAETFLDRAAIVSVELPDTIWLEIGPILRLFGGEERLLEELSERLIALGHVHRLVVAHGPRSSQLLARHALQFPRRWLCVPSGNTRKSVAPILLRSLPWTERQLQYLGQLGLVTLGDLTRFAPAELLCRLGAPVAPWLSLAWGTDETPLTPLALPRVLVEGSAWDFPVDGWEPLRFVLRALLTRLEARLMARGEAVTQLSVRLIHDASSARRQGLSNTTVLSFSLISPLWHLEDLERVILLRCDKTKLSLPCVALELTVISPITQPTRQLELWQTSSGLHLETERLTLLVTELTEELGADRVGYLHVVADHRPERQSLLVPFTATPSHSSRRKPRRGSSGPWRPQKPSPIPEPSQLKHFSCVTRQLQEPLALGLGLHLHDTVIIHHRAYVVDSLRFEHRLTDVAWWDGQRISRDYLRVWLRGGTSGFEARCYLERPSGRAFLESIAD